MAIGLIIGGALAAGSAIYQAARQKKNMGLQYEYNQKGAEEDQRRNKEMWDMTNYPEQMKKMQEAGLSPGLMYGQSGGGGVSAKGGEGGQVSQPTERSAEMSLKGAEMGLQLKALESQIKLNEASANKQQAEADKTAGADTEVAQATIGKLIEETTNEQKKRGLIYADTRLKDAEEELTRASVDWTEQKTEETRWNIKSISKDVERMITEINGLELDNEYKQETIRTRIEQTTATLQESLANVLLKQSQTGLTKEQAIAVGEEIAQKWQQIGINLSTKEQGWRGLELTAEKIMNDLNINLQNIDVRERELIKDYVVGIGSVVSNGATQILTKGINNGIKQVVKGLK